MEWILPQDHFHFPLAVFFTYMLKIMVKVHTVLAQTNEFRNPVDSWI